MESFAESLLQPSPELLDARAIPAAGADLLDTGMSPFGWSGISRFVFCPQLEVFTREQGRFATPAKPDVLLGASEVSPRDWGTLGHVGLAHRFGRAGARHGPLRAGDKIIHSPDELLPMDAAVELSTRNRGFDHAVARHIKAYLAVKLEKDTPTGRARGVEILFRAVLGRPRTGPNAGRFGLWVVADPPGGWPAFPTPAHEREYLLNMPEALLIGMDGAQIEPRRMKLRARPDGVEHPWEGKLIWMTRRFDLLEEPSRNVLDLWDHKVSAKMWGQAVVDGYRNDEQFSACRLMLAQVAGPLFGCRAGQVWVNHVHRLQPYVSGKEPLAEVGADSRFPQSYLFRWSMRALMERDVPTEQWDARGIETACITKYGPCDAYNACAARRRHIEGEGEMIKLIS